MPRLRVSIAVLGLTLLSSLACASEYCTKEQHDRDDALIADAFSNGTLVKGPKGPRDSILVQEGMWFGMNYPKQIAFMQSFECAMGEAGGKQLLYMDVRSLATGNLLATWTLGALKPAEGVTNPGMSEGSQGMEDENRIGLTGQARTDFIKSVNNECNKNATSPNYCSCYANALADSVSIKELKEPAPENREAAMNALQPKINAAEKRCGTY